MKKVYFLGTKEVGLSCLKYLHLQQKSLDIEIAGVFTNNRNIFKGTETVFSYCKQVGLDCYADLDELDNLPASEFIISVQYHQILKPKHIRKASKLAVNLHMAPLPEYRGCNQFSFAIIDHKKEFGATLHVLDEGIDSGDILFETRFIIPENISVKSLYERTLTESINLFKEHIGDIFNLDFTRTPQNELIEQRGCETHYRSEIEKIKCIDPHWPTEKIKRYFRATWFPPFPPPYYINELGEKVEITSEWIARQEERK